MSRGMYVEASSDVRDGWVRLLRELGLEPRYEWGERFLAFPCGCRIRTPASRQLSVVCPEHQANLEECYER